jgi:transposase
MNYTTFIVLDVHKETIAVAKIDRNSKEAEFLGTIANTPEAIRNLVKKLGAKKTYYCYEAGFCGYSLYWQLLKLGAACLVAAPSLIPMKPGELKFKTDKRDAMRLAKQLRNGELTAVYIPSREQEALRDLLRARETTMQDLLRKKSILTKFLLRYDVRQPDKMKAWSVRYRKWLKGINFSELPLQIVLEEHIHFPIGISESILISNPVSL